MLKIGLAGSWHVHFEGYANDAAKREDCEIIAFWDPDAEKGKKYAEKYSCEYVADYDEFLKRDFDALMCCTSTEMHPEILIKAANAGKAIFTEKVLAIAYADALKIREAVLASGKKFCISFPWRARGDFLWVKKAIDEKLIGDISYCRMRNAHNGVSGGWLPPHFLDMKQCGGGAMMDLGAHPMYLLNWFMGEPVKITSAYTNFLCKSVDDNCVAVLEYANGAIGVSETAFVAQCNPFSLELVGTKGTIMAGGVADKTAYDIGDGWVYPELPESVDSPLNCWIDGILYGKDIPYTIDDAVALSKTMELSYKNII